MKTKYAKIFKVSDTGSVEVVDGMRDLLIKRRLEPRSMDETPMFSGTITITKADRTSVQNFLWQLMQESNKWDFVYEDSESLRAAKEMIQVNEFDAHLTIVRRMLRLISDNPNPKTGALGAYALSFLPDHLGDLKSLMSQDGLNMLKPSEQREIGDGLISLFVSTNIEKHWGNCDWVVWYGKKEEVDVFLDWLADEAVTRHLGAREYNWVREVRGHKTPARPLLSDIMKMMAKRWLRDSTWEAPAVYEWLEDYLIMVRTQSLI